MPGGIENTLGSVKVKIIKKTSDMGRKCMRDGAGVPHHPVCAGDGFVE